MFFILIIRIIEFIVLNIDFKKKCNSVLYDYFSLVPNYYQLSIEVSRY